ncbi:ABC transporter permease [Dyadobacter psychrotolerans]|uniref:FtsX-like permease family protein n=1 Tax=Dyadobacter psychrotolerans TaxID=2541721 RepID=A0A4R5DRW8_9BACT|nr:ABC transporter permease [Dyadobacter psychrotolerans]TDE14801.1 FtsX-like permease family protein [Dyadobacter psychrotolerans]
MNQPQAPRWAKTLLRWLHPENTLEEVEGDLDELYAYSVQRFGKRQALLRYLLNVATVLPPFVPRRRGNKKYEQSFSHSPDMLKNYFKIAWRNIVRQKAYSILNIAGLSIGMACSILILLWVQNELSYDRFHTRAGQLFRLTCTAGDFKTAVSAAGMSGGLQSELPQITSGVRISKLIPMLFEAGEKKVEEKRVFYADSNFLEVFSFPLLAGNAATALKDPGAILITEEIAEKYYGNRDAVGKTIRINNKDNFTIAGILANTPSNSHLQFDVIIPMKTMAKWDWDLKNDTWGNFNFYTYLELDEKTAASASARQKLTQQIGKIFKDRGQTIQVDFQLQPLTDIHLHSNLQIDLPGHGNIQYVNIFFVVAIFILFVACINFMNLATARSERRAKEVGLRKVVGANRHQLVFQFLGESLIFSFLSLVIAIGIVFLLLPVFKMLTEKTLAIDLLDGKLLLSLIGIAVLTGLLSGSYPALFLSGFAPVKVLKGKLRVAGGNLLFRNALVVTQFVVAIVLLVGTAVVYKQLDFIKKRNLGFDKSNLLYLPMTGELGAKKQTLKTSLAQNPLTENFTVISDMPTTLATGTTDIVWDGQTIRNQIVFPSLDVDENFIKVFKSQVLAGRGFDRAFSGDSSNYMINEKAMQIMGMNLGNAVGKSLNFGDDKGTIIGVVKDFHFKSLQYAMEPLILRLNKWGGVVMVRTAAGSNEQTIKALEKINQELNPAFPFKFGFLDEDLDNLYRSEQQMGSIFNLFAGLAIFISCLGLYGLSAFMAEQRTKEIGVRKVLGATVAGVVGLLSQDFLKLILIAIVIASPIAWYAMNKWLQGFAYQTTLEWWVIALAGLMATGIALFTISFQSIKAALMNPVRSLRSE